ncbi:MAG: hypothetical protein JNL21_24410 [Myxococcales bacterium]|nr:hypothetical protein [Myxococcales bacterium]
MATAGRFPGKLPLVISSTEGSARVHLNHGRIAWVHRSHHNVSIKAILGDCGIEIDDESCRDLIEESRTSRRHFGDVLVEWGLAEASAIREALRRHVERELGLVLGWTDATATLLRDTRTLASGLSFRLDELGPGSRGRRRIHTQHDIPAVKPLPPRDREATEAWLDRVAAISELEGCALLDAKQGVVLGNRGTAEARLEVAWSMAASLAALGPGAEEVLASSSSMAYLLRPVPAPIGALAFVCFDAGKLSLALARILITKSGTT